MAKTPEFIIQPVDLNKMIYSIKPTRATTRRAYTRALVPMVVVYGGLALAGYIMSKKAEEEMQELNDLLSAPESSDH